MAKPIIGLVPHGGWHYYEGDVRLSGYSYDELLKVVQNYRAENHLPVGDVEGDVNSFICSNYPHNCHGVDMVVVTSVEAPNPASELLNDITTWAKNILHAKKPNILVTDEIAEARAKICKGCTQNMKWKAGCTSCITATERICASIRGARDTKTSASLGGCKAMRHDNRTAVFFDKDVLEKSGNLPAKCWLNK